MNQETTEFLRLAREHHARGLAMLGHELVERTQAEIGDPYPPASEPGTPPHRRTGNLQDGVTSNTAITEREGVILTVVSERAEGDERVPIFLEFGTSNMEARPYMRPQKDRIESDGIDGVIGHLRLP